MCCEMTALRLIPLPLHGALEMLVGMFLMAAPVALGLGPAPSVLGFVIGALAVGMALSSTATSSEVGNRGTLSVSAHHSVDYGLVTGLLGTAAVLGLAGYDRATIVFAAAGLAQLALNLTTRYSQR